MEKLSMELDKQFSEEVKEMSVGQIQNLLWKLERQLLNMRKQREEEFEASPEKDRLGNIKPVQKKGWVDRTNLNAKIIACRSLLLEKIYAEAAKKSEKCTFMPLSQWGIMEKEPVNIIDAIRTERTYWKKYGGNAPVQEYETMSLTDCGNFSWVNQPSANIQETLNGSIKIPFEVPSIVTPTEKVEVRAEDILKGIAEAEKQYANLKLVKVSLQGVEKLEYFILMSIPQLNSMAEEQKNKLCHFLVKAYISNPHQDMIGKCFEKGKCPFGGIISQNEDGNLELTFNDKYLMAVAHANNSCGICKTLEGEQKIVGSLQDAIDILAGRQKRRELSKALEEVKKGVEGNSTWQK